MEMNTSFNEQSPRILVVDDNPDIHRDFKRILATEKNCDALDEFEKSLFDDISPAGPDQVYEIDFALQGPEGVKKVQEARSETRPFMVAFVDMRMPPGWDGLETIERMWQVDPDIEVVICTAYSDHSWPEIVQRLGKTDKMLLLKKPFDAVEAAQLASALSQKWMLRQQATLKIEDLELMVAERTHDLENTTKRLQQEVAEHKRAEAELKKFSDELATKNRELEATREELAKLNVRLGENLDQRSPEVRELLKRNDELIRRMTGNRGD